MDVVINNRTIAEIKGVPLALQADLRKPPVMLIWGVEDRMVPFALHKTVMALIPRLAFHAVLGAGHIPHFERSGVVNPLIVEFFTGLGGKARLEVSTDEITRGGAVQGAAPR